MSHPERPAGEGDIDAARDEIAYSQVGDNPGRREPGTGEINYRNVFKHIHGRGFTGVVGMEHGDAGQGREGERAVPHTEAYRCHRAYFPPMEDRRCVLCSA